MPTPTNTHPINCMQFAWPFPRSYKLLMWTRKSTLQFRLPLQRISPTPILPRIRIQHRQSKTPHLNMPTPSPKAGQTTPNSSSSHEAWKSQPPYKAHASFRALYSGCCHCGLVQYEISSAQPLDAKFCHCRTCQVLHGLLSPSPLFPSPETQKIKQKNKKKKIPD